MADFKLGWEGKRGRRICWHKTLSLTNMLLSTGSGRGRGRPSQFEKTYLTLKITELQIKTNSIMGKAKHQAFQPISKP
jgi:hypothetical protein